MPLSRMTAPARVRWNRAFYAEGRAAAGLSFGWRLRRCLGRGLKTS